MAMPGFGHGRTSKGNAPRIFSPFRLQNPIRWTNDVEPRLLQSDNSRLCPTKLLQAYGVIPDLRHVPNAIFFKVHRIDIVSRYRLTVGSPGPPGPVCVP